jgi:hypothetical protein
VPKKARIAVFSSGMVRAMHVAYINSSSPYAGIKRPMMAASSGKRRNAGMSGKANAPDEARENDSDAWARFERAVDAAVKSGPRHKITPKAKERPASKGRVHKGKSGR